MGPLTLAIGDACLGTAVLRVGFWRLVGCRRHREELGNALSCPRLLVLAKERLSGHSNRAEEP